MMIFQKYRGTILNNVHTFVAPFIVFEPWDDLWKTDSNIWNLEWGGRQIIDCKESYLFEKSSWICETLFQISKIIIYHL
jgi:hypothetical protein